jgi:TP901 family phage tail tape measure protein
MSVIARLKTEIIADDSKFRSTLKADEAAVKGFGDAFQDANGRWRAANGRFLTDLEKTSAGLKSTESAVARFGASLKTAGDKLQSAGQTLSIGLTAPLLILGKQIADIGFSYERSMNSFQAVTRASAEEMRRAAAVAEKLGADMTLPATSAADAANALTALAKSGLSASESMDAAKGVLQLAAAATIDEARAAEIAGNALNVFGLAASESGRVADLLAGASAAASGEITDMASAMQQSGSSAAALGIPIEDLVTSIGLMAKNGILGSDAGTSLKTMMASLTPSTKEAAGAMKALGIDAFDAKGNFVGLEAVIAQAAPALAKMTVEQRAFAIEAAFGSDAQRAANIILGEGVQKFNDMASAVGQSGAAADLAAAKTKGLSGAWDGFISQLETAGLKVFQQVSPMLENVVRGLADMASGFSTLNPAVVKFGLAATALVGSAGPIALLASKLLTFGVAGAVTVAVIAGAAAMAGAYATNFAQMTSTVDSFAASFMRAMGQTKTETGAWGDLMTQTGIFVAQMVDIVLTGLSQIANLMGGIVRANIALMKGDFSGAFKAISEGFSGVADAGDKFNTRLEKRTKEMQIAIEQGAKGHMEYLRVINSTGGTAAGDAFFTGFTQADPFGRIRKVSGVEMSSLTGYLRSTGISAGVALGSGLKEGAHSATHQSPFFIIHWLQDAAKYAQNEAPTEFAKAGSKMGDKLKEGFQAALGNINDFLGRAIGGTGSISDSVFDIILRKMPEVAKQLGAQATGFRETNKAIELYAALMTTASGRNTIFAQTVTISIQRLLDFDKSLRGEVIPSFANLGGEIQSTTIITKEFGEAIAKSIVSLVEASVLTLDKFKEGFKNTGAAASEWGKVMSDGVKKLKDEIKSNLGDGVGGVLISLADTFKINLSKVNDWSSGVLDIIGGMPGKIGDRLRNATSKFLDFVNGIDRMFKGLHKIFDSVPDGLGGMISKIAGMLKGAGGAGGLLGGLFGGGASAGAGAWGAAKGAGAAGGSGGGFLGAIGGWAGIAGIAGAALPAIISLFKGKSQIEKDTEKAQLDQLKANIAQTYEDIKSTMVDTMAKGNELLESLATRVDVPRKAIRRFINQFGLLLELFIDEAKRLAPKGLDAAKQVTESLGGSFELMMGAVDLSKAIKGMEEASNTDVAAFKNSSTKLFNALFEVFDEIELSVAKQSGKKAGKMEPIISFVTAIPDAIKAAIATPDISTDQIAAAFGSARKFIDAFFAFSEDLIGYALNKVSRGAGQIQSIFDSSKSIFESLGFFGNYKPIEDASFAAINTDISKVTSWMNGLIGTTATWATMGDALQSNVTKWADGLGRTANAIKAAVSGASSLSSGSNITANIQSGNGASYLRSGNGAAPASAAQHITYNSFQVTLSLRELEELATVPGKLEELRQRLSNQTSRTGQNAQAYGGY